MHPRRSNWYNRCRPLELVIRSERIPVEYANKLRTFVHMLYQHTLLVGADNNGWVPMYSQILKHRDCLGYGYTDHIKFLIHHGIIAHHNGYRWTDDYTGDCKKYQLLVPVRQHSVERAHPMLSAIAAWKNAVKAVRRDISPYIQSVEDAPEIVRYQIQCVTRFLSISTLAPKAVKDRFNAMMDDSEQGDYTDKLSYEGRFYCAYHNAPKSDKQWYRINGERVTVVDISRCYYVAMAIDQKMPHILNQLGDVTTALDALMISQDWTDFEPTRQAEGSKVYERMSAKKLLNLLIVDEARARKGTSVRRCKGDMYLALRLAGLSDVVDCIIGFHAGMRTLLHLHPDNESLKKVSQMAIRILNNTLERPLQDVVYEFCSSRDIPFFSIHDAFLVPESCAKELFGVLESHYQTTMGITLGLSMETAQAKLKTLPSYDPDYDDVLLNTSLNHYVAECIQFKEILAKQIVQKRQKWRKIPYQLWQDRQKAA
jgi:hypothetical protein